MPSESTSSLEPQFTTTSCMCPYAQYGKHETSCISANTMRPPNPRAGKRAWKNYRDAQQRTKARAFYGITESEGSAE